MRLAESGQIMFEVSLRVLQVSLNSLEERFRLPARSVAQHLTHLMRGERARPVSFGCDRFEHSGRHITPL